MDHTIIPQEWKKFLSTIHTLYPSAIIAGGALRDTIMDLPVKDVDIFITDCDVNIDDIANLFSIKTITGSADDDTTRDHIKLSHDIKTLKLKQIDKKKHSKGNAHGVVNQDYVSRDSFGQSSITESVISLIYDVQYNGTIYQLIFVEQDPVSMVYSNFDFGICKVYFDGIDMVITDEFWYDFENKQLTIAGKFSAGQLFHTLFTHRVNLMKKFPNWKVVIDDLALKTTDEMPPSHKKLMELQQSQPTCDDDTMVDFKFTESSPLPSQAKKLWKSENSRSWMIDTQVDGPIFLWPAADLPEVSPIQRTTDVSYYDSYSLKELYDINAELQSDLFGSDSRVDRSILKQEIDNVQEEIFSRTQP